MWSNEKSRKDKSGKRWNFCYWYSGTFAEKSRTGQRLFFWDENQVHCGVVLFSPTVPYTRIRNLITELVADPTLREQHRRDLSFPLKRYYSEYGAFPEENSN
jgi:hypothetical protein